MRSSKLDYLGFCFAHGRIRLTDVARLNFKRELRWWTGRHRLVSMNVRLAKLRSYVQGWMNYYGLSGVYRDWPGLDNWLRRRIRMCNWVMWKRPRPRIRNLRALGAPIRQAVGLGRSSLGPWKCARLLGLAMSKSWLEKQGLICLADDWWRWAPFR